MKLFRKIGRQVAPGSLEDAAGRADAVGNATEYERVRTASGRTAHLQQAPPGVLCGWRGQWQPADPSLPVCRACQAEMEKLSSGEAVA